MSKSIEVNDLNVYYGDFLAVEGVSLDIQPRSVTAFIGPSGCGKSTFLRTLNRMHEVIPGARVEGEVLLDGKDLYGPGIDPAVADNLFTPFVTGKAEGLGLGLGIARDIAREFGGALDLVPSPLGGAAFRLTVRRA